MNLSISRLERGHLLEARTELARPLDEVFDFFANAHNLQALTPPFLHFEILTPDFRGCQVEALDTLAEALPFVFAHNVETVPSLYPKARSGGDYALSLHLLEMAKSRYGDVPIKSSLMLGLGETDAEVTQVLQDLRQVGCDRVTIGQYLRPSKNHHPVVEYVHPELFREYRQIAESLGFPGVASGPYVRSSYKAAELYRKAIGRADMSVSS